ncbi:MAG: HDIG domain-containing metalloprotein [Candidatus Omnitrophota bacterium]
MKKQAILDRLPGYCLISGVFLFSYLFRINLALPLSLVLLAIYLKARNLDVKGASLLNISFLFLIIFVLSYFILKENLPFYFIPFSFIPLLSTLLFNNLELTLLLTLASSFSVSSISSNPIQLGSLFLISGLLSGILALGSRRIVQIIQAGFLTGIGQVAALIFLENFWLGEPLRYLFLVLSAIVSGIIAFGILPIFEYLFNIITNIRLLELADFNHPLLKRLILEAPGTYHHSLVVGNLSESASEAVGANSLLARIGAYYHDIGKILKPEYFSENQELGSSKHEKLSPTMSKIIIMNHVKDGVELAKKYKLRPQIIDFIQQHHGKSLVYYFYRKALEGLEDDREVREEGFRYLGPKPDSKEAAIVLLADSVEAASRALKEPLPSRIEEVVHKTINNKFIDGQLDECDLTLRDLERISAVFIRLLNGIYRSRVAYPEETRSENNRKKFPEGNPHQSEKDKKGNS